MKKFLTLLLSISLISSMIYIPAFAEELPTEITEENGMAVSDLQQTDEQPPMFYLEADNENTTFVGILEHYEINSLGAYVYTFTTGDDVINCYSDELYEIGYYYKVEANKAGKILSIFNLGQYAGYDVGYYSHSDNNSYSHYVTIYTPDSQSYDEKTYLEKSKSDEYETNYSNNIPDDYEGYVVYWYSTAGALYMRTIEIIDTYRNVEYDGINFSVLKQPCNTNTKYINYYNIPLTAGNLYTIDVLNYGSDASTSYIAVYPPTTKINDNISYEIYGRDNNVYLSGTGELTADDAEAFKAIPKKVGGTLVVGEGITAIKNIALSSFSGVEIPSSLTVLENVFNDTRYGMRASMFVDENNSVYKSVSGTLFNKDMTELIHFAGGAETFWEKIGSSSYSRTRYTVPETVTKIVDKAFSYSNINYVYLPEGLEYIGEGAFSNCEYLNRMSIPEGIEMIRKDTFNGCSELTRITLPESLTSIGENAFWDCYALSYAYIPLTLTQEEQEPEYDPETGEYIEPPEVPNTNLISIGKSAFGGCAALTELELPDSIIEIGEGAFAGCGFSEFKLPPDIEIISNSLFERCKTLESIELPETITSIGDNAFNSCYKLSNIYIPLTLTQEEQEPKYDPETGEYIEPPEVPNTNLVSIGKGAFKWCVALKTITLPDSITEIGEEAFAQCEALTELIIPDSVTSLGELVVDNCNNLEILNIGNGVTHISMGDLENLKTLIIGANVEHIETVPSSVVTIELSGDNTHFCLEDGVLYNADKTEIYFIPANIEVFTIPDSITGYWELRNLFQSCTRLRELNTGNGLTTLSLPTTLTQLKKITIGANIKDIGYIPKNIETIELSESNTYFAYENGSLFNKYKTELLFVPKNIVSYDISESVHTISSYAFSDCTNLKSIVIPDSVTKIASYAFEGCTALESITMTESVTDIGWSAFYGCYDLSIKCYKDTAAYDYAIECEIPYEFIEDTRNTIVLRVYDENGEEITSGFSVYWICDKRIEGATLRNADKDIEYDCLIELEDRLLAFKYLEPEAFVVQFQSDNNLMYVSYKLLLKPYDIYEIDGGYILFDKETGTVTDLTTEYYWAAIPYSIDGITVQKISYDVIYNNQEQIGHLRIPETVTEITNIPADETLYDLLTYGANYLSLFIKENSPIQAWLEANGITDEIYVITETENGDVNDDGFINSNDAVYLSDYLNEPEKYPLAVSGDIDGNGTIDIDDIKYIIENTEYENSDNYHYYALTTKEREVTQGGKVSLPVSVYDYIGDGEYAEIKSLVLYDIDNSNGLVFDTADVIAENAVVSIYDEDNREIILTFRKNTQAEDIIKLCFAAASNGAEGYQDVKFKARATVMEYGEERQISIEDYDDAPITIIKSQSNEEDNISFTDIDGYEIQSFKEAAGKDINITVSLTDDIINSEDAIDLYFAQYDKNGVLSKVDISDKVTRSNIYTVTPYENATSLKVFVWNNNNKPIIDVSELN